MLVIVAGIHKEEDVMNRHIGTSLLLAAMVALGLSSAAKAGDFSGTEEDLAVPQGSFISTMAIPAHSDNVLYIAKSENGESELAAAPAGTEEDLAVPHGSFTSTMPFPSVREDRIRVANAAVHQNGAVIGDDRSRTILSEVVAAGLE